MTRSFPRFFRSFAGSGLCLLALAAPLAASAQAAASQPAATQASAQAVPSSYDVASIHPHDPGKNQGFNSSFANGKMDCENIDLTSLFSMAYDVREGLISGIPAWANNTRWDIHAKVLGMSEEQMKALHLTDAQQRQFVINLLAERFHAKVHWETKQLPVYDLVVAKNGPKFEANAAQNAADLSTVAPGSFMMQWSTKAKTMAQKEIPLSALVRSLADELDRTVIDKTGLTGKYTFDLKYMPSQPTADATSDGDLPSIFGAVEDELGLKLVPTKGPVATLVIDHVDPPTDN